MNLPKVSVITATVGNPLLARNLASVVAQDYPGPLQHLVVIDGPQHEASARAMIGGQQDVMVLPYATGLDRFNGHRIYGAGAFLAQGDWLIHLDDDNFLQPDHVSSLVDLVQSRMLDWAFSLRQIYDSNGFVCEDNCESLGLWPSVLRDDDYFIDVNCYFLSRRVALTVAPIWYTKMREPGRPEVDRQLAFALRKHFHNFGTTQKHTLGYHTGNSELSVRPEFFLKGNQIMLSRYGGQLPWKT